MKHWRIENTVTGIIFGTYAGETESDALDSMARDAGYRDYRETQVVAPALASEIEASEVELDCAHCGGALAADGDCDACEAAWRRGEVL